MVHHRVLDENPPNTGVEVDGLTGELLTQQQMFVRSNFAVPLYPPDGFELVIPGRPSRLMTPEHLHPFQPVDRDIVLECAGNGRAFMDPIPEGTAWMLDGASPITVGGVRLRDVLGPLPDEVVEVVFTGADMGTTSDGGRVPYQFSISRELAESAVPMLVTHIGNEPLTVLHGAPIRLVVPGHYGMKSVKWLVRVEAVTEPFNGYFVERYRYLGDPTEAEGAPVGEIAVRSVISSPLDGDVLPAEPLEISGSAWSGTGEIASVQVSVDGGDTWQEAELVRRQVGGRWAPVKWAATADVSPGSVEVVARATDESGATQPLESRWNANGYANNVTHRITIEVA